MKSFWGFKVRHVPRIVLGFVILGLLIAHLIGRFELGFIDKLERLAYDVRLVSRMPKGIDPRIVIVDIDEKSLNIEGQWPWRRDRLKVLVDHLFDHYQSAIVGFDVVFAEPDASDDLSSIKSLANNDNRQDLLQYLTQIEPQLDRDRVLMESFKNRAVILGYYFNQGESTSGNIGQLPESVFPAALLEGSNLSPLKMTSFSANLASLQQAAHSAGFFQNDRVDEDGFIRRVPMLVEHNNELYESLSLAILRTLLDDAPVFPLYASEGQSSNTQNIDYLQVGDFRVPVDHDVTTLVPYRGQQGSFHYISATDVLTKTAKADVLKNAIVLVGTTAPGLLDLRSTPMQNLYPGVEIHANMIAGFLDQNIKNNPAHTIGYELIYLLLLGLFLVLLFPRLSPLWLTLTALFFVGVVITLDWWLWHKVNLVLHLAMPLLFISALLILNMSYGFFIEARSKRKLGSLFGEYVPPAIVEKMSENPSAIKDLPENKEMTVLFSDVRGFTTISEGLDPKELSELMNAFLSPLTRVIHERGGTIDKYMGDAIMAFWGAPLPDKSHARHAVDAGMAMLKEVEIISATFKERDWPALRIGCGLNTGSMSVGNMGSEFRRAYTVLGDAVNLGARCESITKQYGVLFIVAENTYAAVPEYAYRELDLVKVKGKNKPVALYEPIALVDELDAEQKQELADYHEALALYRQQKWTEAEQILTNLQAYNKKKMIYAVYLSRLAEFRANPPEKDWDGVFTSTSK